MASTFLVLTGVHSAGKTSVAEYLHDQGLRVEFEIPQKFVEAGRYEFTTDTSTSFQEAVFEEERDRDRGLLREGANAVIVSWHVAEIAHSLEKAPSDLVDRQKSYVDELLDEGQVDVRGVHLSVSNEEMRRRSPTDEGTLYGYYDSIRENIFDLYEEFGIEYRVVENPQGELQRTCERVESYAREYL